MCSAVGREYAPGVEIPRKRIHMVGISGSPVDFFIPFGFPVYSYKEDLPMARF